MSAKVRVVAVLHPFKLSSRVDKWVDKAPLRDIYMGLGPVLPVRYARFMVGDRVVGPDYVPEDGDVVYIRVVPAGGGDSSPRDKGMWGQVIGIVSFIAGVALSVLPGFQGVAAGLITSGISMFLGGLALYNMDLSMKVPEHSKVDPSLRGSRNRANQNGVVPVVLGRHRLSPDLAALPFSYVSGNSQYLKQLFCLGYNDVEVVQDSLKLGETPLSMYDEASVSFVSDGVLGDFSVKEIGVGREVKNRGSDGSAGDVVVSTPSNAKKIAVMLSFPQGLVKYNDDGDKEDCSVRLAVEYSPAGLSSWRSIWSGTVTRRSTSTVRLEFSRVLDNAVPSGSDFCPDNQYDVRVRRLSPDNSDGRVIDRVYLVGVRVDVAVPPVSSYAASMLLFAWLDIRASEQLQGVVDNFNCVVQLKARDYMGSGSGPSAWSVRATSNPASCFLYLLTGQANPEPVSDDRIDWKALEDWYVFCEQHGYECNAVVSSGERLDKLLMRVAKTGRASFAMRDGLFSVIVDNVKPAPVQVFTPRNSRSFSGQKLFPSLPHALKVEFVNAALGWQHDQRLVYAPGFDESSAERIQELNLWGVTDPDQAWKLGRYMLACSYLRPEVFSVEVDVEHLVCTRGDRVQLAHDVPMLGLVSGRLCGVVMDGDFVFALELDEAVSMEAGRAYGIVVRRADGSVWEATLIADEGVRKVVRLLEPVSLAPAVGDLFVVGELGREVLDCLVAEIRPQGELSARLMLVPYSPEIFDVDKPDFEIPPYVPLISKPGSVDSPVVVDDTDAALVGAVQAGAQSAGRLDGSVSYEELSSTGWDVAGGSSSPNVISGLVTRGFFRAVVLKWDRQINLTNLSHYELQVSESASGPWYELGTDGSDWKGALDGITRVDGESFVHAGIPLVEDSDGNRTDRSLFYRVRQVTKMGVVSDWCEPVEGTAQAAYGADIAAGSITANQLEAGAVNAAVANINEQLTIDDTGFVAGLTDDYRFVLRESGVFALLNGKVKASLTQEGLSGDASGLTLPALSIPGTFAHTASLYKTMAKTCDEYVAGVVRNNQFHVIGRVGSVLKDINIETGQDEWSIDLISEYNTRYGTQVSNFDISPKGFYYNDKSLVFFIIDKRVFCCVDNIFVVISEQQDAVNVLATPHTGGILVIKLTDTIIQEYSVKETGEVSYLGYGPIPQFYFEDAYVDKDGNAYLAWSKKTVSGNVSLYQSEAYKRVGICKYESIPSPNTSSFVLPSGKIDDVYTWLLKTDDYTTHEKDVMSASGVSMEAYGWNYPNLQSNYSSTRAASFYDNTYYAARVDTNNLYIYRDIITDGSIPKKETVPVGFGIVDYLTSSYGAAIKFGNGLQISWGYRVIGTGSSSNPGDVRILEPIYFYPSYFTAKPYVVFSPYLTNYSQGEALENHYSLYQVESNFFRVCYKRDYGTTGSNNETVGIYYIAIGPYK